MFKQDKITAYLSAEGCYLLLPRGQKGHMQITRPQSSSQERLVCRTLVELKASFNATLKITIHTCKPITGAGT